MFVQVAAQLNIHIITQCNMANTLLHPSEISTRSSLSSLCILKSSTYSISNTSGKQPYVDDDIDDSGNQGGDIVLNRAATSTWRAAGSAPLRFGWAQPVGST